MLFPQLRKACSLASRVGENITISIDGLAYVITMANDKLFCMLLANPAQPRELTQQVFNDLQFSRSQPVKHCVSFFTTGDAHA